MNLEREACRRPFLRPASLRWLGHIFASFDRSSVFAWIRMSKFKDPLSNQLALNTRHAHTARIPSYFARLWGFWNPEFFSFWRLRPQLFSVSMVELPNATACSGLFRVAEEDVLVDSSDRQSGKCASVSFNYFFARISVSKNCIFFIFFVALVSLVLPQSSYPRHGEVPFWAVFSFRGLASKEG